MRVTEILHVRNKINACIEISDSMYALDELDSCNFCNEGL